MIRSFKNELTRAAFEGEALKGFPADLLAVTRRKLSYLNAATTLADLMAPPGNRLEALKGGRRGQHSIRVNDHTGFVSRGLRRGLKRWNLLTIIDRSGADWVVASLRRAVHG